MTKKKRERRILAWHYCRADRRLGYGDGRKIRVGETLSVEGKPMLCVWGLHASRIPLRDWCYAAGNIACRVQVWGSVRFGRDKLVGQHRKCLAMVNATRIISEWRRWCRRRPLAMRKQRMARLHKMLLAAIAAQKKTHATK